MRKILIILLAVLITLSLVGFVAARDGYRDGHRGGHRGDHYRGPYGPAHCFIASTLYGENDNHVLILREFRDKWLLSNKAGKKFVSFYYQNGPAVAGFIGEHKYLKPAGKAALLPLVGAAFLINNLS